MNATVTRIVDILFDGGISMKHTETCRACVLREDYSRPRYDDVTRLMNRLMGGAQ